MALQVGGEVVLDFLPAELAQPGKQRMNQELRAPVGEERLTGCQGISWLVPSHHHLVRSSFHVGGREGQRSRGTPSPSSTIFRYALPRSLPRMTVMTFQLSPILSLPPARFFAPFCSEVFPARVRRPVGVESLIDTVVHETGPARQYGKGRPGPSPLETSFNSAFVAPALHEGRQECASRSA
jgi:hypothetical protein